MDTRASRCAMWKLHAPPSRYKEFNPAKERTAKLTPNRVTFLNGPNRDFPKWRRHESRRLRLNPAPPRRVDQDHHRHRSYSHPREDGNATRPSTRPSVCRVWHAHVRPEDRLGRLGVSSLRQRNEDFMSPLLKARTLWSRSNEAHAGAAADHPPPPGRRSLSAGRLRSRSTRRRSRHPNHPEPTQHARPVTESGSPRTAATQRGIDHTIAGRRRGS
jgi:hypothetical protein